MWIDSHCHLADLRLEDELDLALKHAKIKGISLWVQGGISPQDWQRQERLKAQYPNQICTSYGLHPWWISENKLDVVEEAFRDLEASLAKADALGELGLDYGKRFQDQEVQNRQLLFFEKQLKLAEKTKKTVVLHIVEAHSEAIQILKKYQLSGGIVHSFSAGIEQAKAYMEMGLSLSISGVITREGYKKLKEAVKTLPKDKIVLETDCPDQKLKDEQQELNLPENLLKVAEAVAQIRGESAEEVLSYSTENAKRIFSL